MVNAFDNELVAGALIALAGAVVGAVLQWRLSFYLARGLRADARREEALLALEDKASAVGQLAESHVRIKEQHDPAYVQQNI
jgi:hypothetical protein